MRLSAYLSIFDDWDILPHALAAIAPHVDEIVVVDGAYRWMAPMLQSTGRDPTRSLPEVHAALHPYTHKLRIIDGLWDDELHKREAGYAACHGRYILRFDADEIMCVTPGLIAAAIARNHPVAAVEMPTYVLPGWLGAAAGADGSLGDIERQCVFFDSSRISAQQHLAYLWLVLGKAEQTRLGRANPAMIDPTPLAFNAHLTCWRTPATARHRARFYVMNWMRDAGTIPWLGGIAARADDGFAAFFRAMPPRNFEAFLSGHEITAGQPGFGQATTRPAPSHHPGLDAAVDTLFRAFTASLATLNRDLAQHGRLLLSEAPCCIDISTPDAVSALGAQDGIAGLLFDQPLADLQAHLLELNPAKGIARRTPLHVAIEGNVAWLPLPALPEDTKSFPIRRTMQLIACIAPADRPIHMTASPARPKAAATIAALAQAARARSAAQDWQAAAGAWQLLAATNDHAEEAQLRLGEALREAGAFAEAEMQCSQARLLYPENLWISRNWALLAMRQKNWREAARRFTIICAQHSHDALDADLAECLIATGDIASARAVLDRATEACPASPWLQRVSRNLDTHRQIQAAPSEP